MTTRFRTLLLLGFTALAGLSSGCIIETTSTPNNNGCLDSQYFNVKWEVDDGTLASMFSCGATPPSHVLLTTNTGIVLDVGRACQDGGLCSDGSPCNWSGSTNGGIPVGTSVILARLISDLDGMLLSSAPGPNVVIAPCTPVELGFQFPLM
jgi:hypothetical protein